MVKKTPIESNVVTDEPAAENAVSTHRVFSESDYRSIGTMADAVELWQQTTGEDIVQASEELGDGFTPMTEGEKRKLCANPLFIMQWEFKFSDTVTRDGKPVEYVSVRVIAERFGKTEKYVFSDGSSGIYRQLRAYTDRTGRQGGMLAPLGLRVSDYKFKDPTTGDETPASTFYIDLATL